MEYANEDILNIGYRKEKTSYFNRYRVLNIIVVTTALLIGIDIGLIYLFFSIFHTI